MKAIFFNPKGVIYARPDPTYYLRSFLETQGVQSPPDLVIKKLYPNMKEQIMRGRLPREVYCDAVLKACGVTNAMVFPEGERAIERDSANIVLLPGVAATLHTLKERGFKLGIITDAFVAREKKIAWMKAAGLQVDWDGYSNSKDLEAVKPDPRLYQSAMQQAGVSPAESIFVGKNTVEVAGAKKLGMVTVAAYYEAGHEADYFLVDFEDLLSLPMLQSPA